MPTTSGLISAPLTTILLLLTISTALLTTILDMKHHFPLILPILSRLSPRRYLFRLFFHPVTYTSSSEVLFASLTLYHLRVLERIWGTRKLASFGLAVLPYTTAGTIVSLYTLGFATRGWVDRVPSGMTALLWAGMAQWCAGVPYSYKYRISTPFPVGSTPAQPAGSSSTTNDEESRDIGVLLTSKSLSYLPALQLALSALPGSLIPAAVGWSVGWAWRYEMLPWPRGQGWRINETVWKLLGGSGSGQRGGGARMEGLRRRMVEGEDEDRAGEGARVQASGSGSGTRRTGAGFGLESMLGARPGGVRPTSGRRDS